MQRLIIAGHLWPNLNALLPLLQLLLSELSKILLIRAFEAYV